MNLALYLKSMSFISSDFHCKRFCRTTADGYMYELVKQDVDFVINIDEDAFLYDKKALYSLLDYVIENDYVNCGMRDGGAIGIRSFHPLVTNPFFNILNIRKIKSVFDLKVIDNTPIYLPKYDNLIPPNLNKEFMFCEFEPYYNFFIWLALNFKTLYLNALVHSDTISTILLNQNNEPFLLHSWYSREYGNDIYHTRRINNLYEECKQNINSGQNSILFILKNKLHDFLFEKIFKRVLRIVKFKLMS
jgi:hypothetical protein